MSAASFEPSGEDGPGDPEVLEEKRHRSGFDRGEVLAHHVLNQGKWQVSSDPALSSASSISAGIVARSLTRGTSG